MKRLQTLPVQSHCILAKHSCCDHAHQNVQMIASQHLAGKPVQVACSLATRRKLYTFLQDCLFETHRGTRGQYPHDRKSAAGRHTPLTLVAGVSDSLQHRLDDT